jgi:hypothetical protein
VPVPTVPPLTCSRGPDAGLVGCLPGAQRRGRACMSTVRPFPLSGVPSTTSPRTMIRRCGWSRSLRRGRRQASFRARSQSDKVASSGRWPDAAASRMSIAWPRVVDTPAECAKQSPPQGPASVTTTACTAESLMGTRMPRPSRPVTAASRPARCRVGERRCCGRRLARFRRIRGSGPAAQLLGVAVLEEGLLVG